MEGRKRRRLRREGRKERGGGREGQKEEREGRKERGGGRGLTCPCVLAMLRLAQIGSDY